jgi:hypothetical protein
MCRIFILVSTVDGGYVRIHTRTLDLYMRMRDAASISATPIALHLSSTKSEHGRLLTKRPTLVEHRRRF